LRIRLTPPRISAKVLQFWHDEHARHPKLPNRRPDRAPAPLKNTLAGTVVRCYNLTVENRLLIVSEVVIRIPAACSECRKPGWRMCGAAKTSSFPW